MPTSDGLDDLLRFVFLLVLVATWVWAGLLRRRPRNITITERQAGVLFRNGRVQRVVGPGRYKLWRPGTTLIVESLEEQLQPIREIEVQTADTLFLRINVSVRHKTVDPRLHAHLQGSWHAAVALTREAEVAVSKAALTRSLVELVSDRGAYASCIKDLLNQPAQFQGTEVVAVEIIDLRLPRNIKRAHAAAFRKAVTTTGATPIMGNMPMQAGASGTRRDNQ